MVWSPTTRGEIPPTPGRPVPRAKRSPKKKRRKTEVLLRDAPQGRACLSLRQGCAGARVARGAAGSPAWFAKKTPARSHHAGEGMQDWHFRAGNTSLSLRIDSDHLNTTATATVAPGDGSVENAQMELRPGGPLSAAAAAHSITARFEVLVLCIFRACLFGQSAAPLAGRCRWTFFTARTAVCQGAAEEGGGGNHRRPPRDNQPSGGRAFLAQHRGNRPCPGTQVRQPRCCFVAIPLLSGR
jgi:hypothetical protein